MIVASDGQGQKYALVFSESFLLRSIDDSLEVFIRHKELSISFKLKVSIVDDGKPEKDESWYDENEPSCLLIIHKLNEQSEEEISKPLIFDIPGRSLFITTTRSLLKYPYAFSVSAWVTVYIGDTLINGIVLKEDR